MKSVVGISEIMVKSVLRTGARLKSFVSSFYRDLSEGEIARSIQSTIFKHLLIILLVFFAVPIGFLSWRFVVHEEAEIHERTLTHLQTVADGVEAQLREFLNYLKGRTQDFSSDGFIRDAVAEIIRKVDGNQETVATLNRHLAVNKQPIIPEVEETFVTNLSGVVIASSRAANLGNDYAQAEFFRRGQTETYISDVFFDDLNGRNSWVVATPLTDKVTHELNGVLVNRIRVGVLSDITSGRRAAAMGSRTFPSMLGQAGETYLVNRDRLMITKTQFHKDAILNQVIDTWAVRIALEEGREITADYDSHHDSRISGATKIIDEPGWVLVTEMDFGAAFAPVVQLRNRILAIVGALIFGLAGVILFLAQRIVVPIERIVQANRALVEGDESAAFIREAVIPNNELGEVMRSRNLMLSKLQKREQQRMRKLSQVVEQMSESVVITDEEGSIEYVNPAFESITGFSEQEALGNKPWLLISDDHDDVTYKRFWKTIFSGRDYKGVLISKRKNGGLFYEERNVTPILAATGEITHYVSISRDITKRVQAEEALVESENRYRTITDTATDAIITADEEGLITLANPAAEKLFGYPSEELIGQPVTLLMPGKYKHSAQKGLNHFIKTREKSVDWDLREQIAHHRDGREIPVEISYGRFVGDGGMSFVAIIRDISERKAAEDELRRESAYIKLLQDVAVAANESVSVESAFQLCINRVCELTSWPVGHVYLLSKDCADLMEPIPIWHIDDPDQFQVFIDVTAKTTFEIGIGLPGRVLASGKPGWIIDVTKDDNFIRAKMAKEIGVKAGFAFPVLIEDKVHAVLEFFSPQSVEPDERLLEVMAHIGTQIGRVIERKKAEEALRASEQKYRNLVDSSAVGVANSTVGGEILYANEAALRIIGYDSLEDVQVGGAITRYKHPEDRERLLKQLQASGSVENFELSLLTKTGGEVEVLLGASLDGDLLGITLIDITERKRAESVDNIILSISQAASTTDSLESLACVIQEQLGTLIDTKNFYVALFDETSNTYSLPYYRDQFNMLDKGTPVSIPNGMTDYVRSSGKSKIFTENSDIKALENGELASYGTPSKCWLGVPLITPRGVLGVLGIQSYDNETAYSKKDLKLIDGIAGTVAIVIERKQAEEALKESEALLRKAQEVARIGHWKLIPATGEITGSDELFRIFGLSREEATLDSFVEVVHPDDREMDVAAIQRGAEHGENWDIEHRLVRRDGEEIWVNAIGETIADGAGVVIELVGTVQDITERKRAEEALRKSEEQFRTLAEKSPNMIFINKNDQIVYANRQSQTVMGYSLEEFLAPDFDFRTLVAAESRDLEESNSRKHSQGKDVEPYDCTLITKDGRRIETIIATKLIEYGDAGAILGIVTDITAHKQVEEALQVERSYLEMLQAVTAAANEAACFEDAVRVALEHVCRHTGWPVGHVYLPDEEQAGRLVSSDIWYLKNPKKYKTFLEVTKEATFTEGFGLPGRVLATGEPAWIKDLAKDKNFLRNGMAKNIGLRSGFAFPVKVGSEVVAVLEFFAEQLTEPDGKLLEIINHVGTEVGRALERNEALETLKNIAVGASAKTGKAFFTSLVEHLARLLGADYAFIGELAGPKKQQVKTVAVYGNGEKQENFEHGLKGTPCNVALSSGKICFHPKGVQQLFPDDKMLVEMGIEAYFGMPLLDSQGKTVGILVVINRTPLTKETLIKSTLEIFAARVAAELERQAAEGELQQAHDRLETRVEERTAELAESSRKYRHLFEHAHDSIFIVDPKTRRIIDVNENTIRRLGYTRQELLKLTIDDLSAPESLVNNDHMLEELGESGSVIFEHLHQRKDGSIFPVEISSRIIQVGDQQVIQSFVRDISERKRAERAQEQLLQELENKNQDLQQILHISSHDLRSPLVSIKGFSGILEKAMGKLGGLISRKNSKSAAEVSKEVNPLLSKEIPAALDHIVASSEKMENLLSGLMRLSRLGQAGMNITELDMNVLLTGITKSIEFLIKKAQVQLEIGELPPSRGDALLIGQVFSNLLGNAVKYLNTERQGVIRISGEKLPGSTVYVVEDNGIGIAPDYQQKVFDLFRRINPSEGDGEGLGLTITRKILDRHHGRIWLESEPGKGSKFFVELPD